jgi:flagellar biosynthetic protein FlhB
MADTPDADRTEQATPRRRDEAHAEGRIARSQELTVAVSLLGSAGVLSAMGPLVGQGLFQIVGDGLARAGTVSLDSKSTVLLLRETATHAVGTTMGLIVSLTVASFVIAALQARGVLSWKPLMPQWSRLSPAANAKNLLGARAIVDLLKSLGKLAIVGGAVYGSVKAALPDAIALSQESQLGFVMIVRTYGVRMLATAGTAYLALAVGDYVWQWWRHEQSIRMTKEEVKQEHKQNEGDPHIKARRRTIARSYARRQMMRDVPKADVIITNPTHIAVAIKYDVTLAPAPIVLAIGQRKIAERIKEIARESGVPMVENKPLARALLKTAKVGTLIPVELYMAVAEVLAFVLRTRRTRGSWEGSALA